MTKINNEHKINTQQDKDEMIMERLEAEIRSANAAVRNAIFNRRMHPSYGYTKAGIRADYERLLGMIEAWLYVSGAWEHPGRVTWAHATRQAASDALGIDLHALADSLRNL